MTETKILLLCSSRFAHPVMRLLLQSNILSGICIPEHCTEMIEQTTQFLNGANIPMIRVNKNNCNEELKAFIQKNNTSICLMATFSFKIAEDVYTLPVKGFYNIHPGPLPQYRGADPVFQQIKNREKLAGVSIHKLDKGFDKGAVVVQEMISLSIADTYGMLTSKLSELAAKLTGVLLQIISFGVTVPGKKQDETLAAYYKIQGAKDITINWETMDAAQIVALVNACNPWNKGAVTKIKNNIVRFLEAEISPGNNSQYTGAGTITGFEENAFTVLATENTVVKVRVVYIEEGFLLAGKLKQLGILPGNCFENI